MFIFNKDFWIIMNWAFKRILIFYAHHLALGEDRTGIVADMTKLVTDNGGSVSESKALKLGSHFSLMMLVSCPKSSVSHLKDSLGSVPDIMTLAVDTTKPVDTIVTAPSVGCKFISRT